MLNKFININEIYHNVPQCEFIYDSNGNLLVDYLIRFEKLKEEFAVVSSNQGWDAQLIHSETTMSKSNTNFRDAYNASMIAEIENIYRRDVELFGYCKYDIFDI